MRRLTTGDRVVAADNPYVAKGTPGFITGTTDSSTISYLVLFEGKAMPLWMQEWQVQGVTTDELPLKPTRILKVGDKVRIESREWYEANKDVFGEVDVPFGFTEAMAKYCGNTYEIVKIEPALSCNAKYRLKEICEWWFSEEMFDMDEPPNDHSFNKVCRVCKGNSEPIIKGNLPLIKNNKLLTNIKLD